MSHLLIYGRNLHAVATEHHNGAPLCLKALLKTLIKRKMRRLLQNPNPIFNKHHPSLIINMISQKIRRGRRKRIE
jgi:hypothetical protein